MLALSYAFLIVAAADAAAPRADATYALSEEDRRGDQPQAAVTVTPTDGRQKLQVLPQLPLGVALVIAR